MRKQTGAVVDRPAVPVRFVFAGGAAGGAVMLVTATDREVRSTILRAPRRAPAARQTRLRSGRAQRVRVNVPARGSRRGATARATAEASAESDGGGSDGEPPSCAQAELVEAEPELAENTQAGPTEAQGAEPSAFRLVEPDGAESSDADELDPEAAARVAARALLGPDAPEKRVRELAELRVSVARGLLRMAVKASRAPAVRSLGDAAAVLSGDAFEALEERAAIQQFDAGMKRDTAERAALTGYVWRTRV